MLFVSYAVVTRLLSFFFFFHDTATTEIYTLSLHDALPIYAVHEPTADFDSTVVAMRTAAGHARHRSEEHTYELQSRVDLVCRLLLEKKKSLDRDVTNKLTKNHSHFCAKKGLLY